MAPQIQEICCQISGNIGNLLHLKMNTYNEVHGVQTPLKCNFLVRFHEHTLA